MVNSPKMNQGMIENVIIRRVVEGDLDACFTIESTCYTTDAVTDAILANVQIEVHSRIVDKLSDGTLVLRPMDETIPLGITSYTNSKGKFKVKVPLDEDVNYFKVIVHTEGYQEQQNVLVRVEHLKRIVVNYQLIKKEESFFYQQTYTVPDQVYVVNLNVAI